MPPAFDFAFAPPRPHYSSLAGSCVWTSRLGGSASIPAEREVGRPCLSRSRAQGWGAFWGVFGIVSMCFEVFGVLATSAALS